MKTMGGVLAVLGAGALLVSGWRSAAQPPVSLSVKMELGTPPSTTMRFLHQVVAGFERKYPNIKVSISTYTGSPATLVDTMVASHQGPNILEIGTTFIPTLAYSQAFVPWTPAMQKQVVPQLIPAATQMDGLAGQRPIGIPDSASPFVLWYNKAMFKQAHIGAPPTTWSQFVADAKKLTNAKKGVYGAGIAPGDPFYSMHTTWLLSRQLGGQVINAKGSQALFASPQVYKAAKFYLDLLTQYHVVNKADVQFAESDLINAFMQGKVAMVPVGGIYDLTQLKTDPKFVVHNLGVAPNPWVPYGRTKGLPGVPRIESFVSGQEQVIFKYSSSPAQVAAATKWIQYYTSAPTQVLMWKEYGDLPVNKGSFRNRALQTPLWKSFLYIEQHSLPTPKVPGWLQLPTVYDKAMGNVFDQAALGKYAKGDLMKTLTSVDSQINATLAGMQN